MAVNVSLMTGHGETEHVTSFDARALNRSILGKDKYLLFETTGEKDYIKVQVSPLTGEIQISKGALLYSGMFIRVEGGLISYTTPATTDYVYVWLHYQRNPENLVETVEFVTTTSSKPNADLIYDVIEDDVTEAYTLFYSFLHNVETNTISNGFCNFNRRLPLADTFRQIVDTLNAALNASNTKIDNLAEIVAENSAAISALPLNISEAVYLGASKADGWITFTESLLNFSFALINVTCRKFTETKLLPRGYLTSAIPLNAIMQDEGALYAITLKLTRRPGATPGEQYGVSTCYAFAHEDKGTLGGGYTQTAISRSDITISAYGIGRIQEA